MGSFVGRNATTTHTKQVWSRYDKPAGQLAKRMTDFGGQQ
jgi:hypothetical protein